MAAIRHEARGAAREPEGGTPGRSLRIHDDGIRHRDFLGDSSVKINVCLLRLNGHYKAIPCWQAIAFQRRPRPPPPCRRIDRDEATAGQFSCRAFPDILVQRTTMSLPFTQ